MGKKSFILASPEEISRVFPHFSQRLSTDPNEWGDGEG